MSRQGAACGIPPCSARADTPRRAYQSWPSRPNRMCSGCTGCELTFNRPTDITKCASKLGANGTCTESLIRPLPDDISQMRIDTTQERSAMSGVVRPWVPQPHAVCGIVDIDSVPLQQCRLFALPPQFMPEGTICAA